MKIRILATVLFGLLGTGAVVAKTAAKKATVIVAEKTCTKVAPNGKAWMTELARGENAFMARLEMAPGAKVPLHRDATEEYIHILSGTGSIVIDGKKSKVGPGATIYMPANAQVTFQNGNSILVGLQVFAGPAPAKKYEKWKGC